MVNDLDILVLLRKNTNKDAAHINLTQKISKALNIPEHCIVIDGYMAVFFESKEHKVVSTKLLARLQPFIRFLNMLVHQYWRVDNKVFLNKLKDGLKDLRNFASEIKQIVNEDSEAAW